MDLNERETHFNVLVDIIGPLYALLFGNPNFFPDNLQPDLCSVEVGNRLGCVDFTESKQHT